MKQKNLLTAKMNVSGIPVNLFCRKTKSGYRWYGGDGTGEQLLLHESLKSLEDAKAAILVAYPPKRFSMEATWL